MCGFGSCWVIPCLAGHESTAWLWVTLTGGLGGNSNLCIEICVYQPELLFLEEQVISLIPVIFYWVLVRVGSKKDSYVT